MIFVLGAAVMFFELPPADFLGKAFIGGRAWFERSDLGAPNQEPDLPPSDLDVDMPQKTSDGYTLCTFASVNGVSSQAYLYDMQLRVQHLWGVPFSKIWPSPQHVPTPVKDSYVAFFACHLYPNGDLLVVLHGVQQTAVGYGLVKLDKDSNILWSYPAGIHHDVDVGPDGTIYAIQHETVNSMPEGLRFIPTPSLVDSLVMLTPDGQPKEKPISVLEAFRDSPYAALLQSLEPAKAQEDQAGPPSIQRFEDRTRKQDSLHTNTIRLLTPEMARRFPEWKAGQLLITMRNLDAIAVVDPRQRTVVWAARGPWQAPHDAQFLDNGNLLLFDNQGLLKGSRVLEYNPRTQAFPWTYSGENWHPFLTSERGMCQRLPNGNTLAVNSKGGEIFEVTRDKEVVWSFVQRRFVAFARRYTADQVSFLPAGTKPRS
ncbi:MAG: arylsulfotransferase family protein [Gemmataceae bacterium]